jgi:hypothetical protein
MLNNKYATLNKQDHLIITRWNSISIDLSLVRLAAKGKTHSSNQIYDTIQMQLPDYFI